MVDTILSFLSGIGLKSIMFFLITFIIGAYFGCTVTCCIVINRDKRIVEQEKFRGE